MMTWSTLGSLVLRQEQGEADALSGRYLSVYDDVRALIARAAEIWRENLHEARGGHHSSHDPTPNRTIATFDGGDLRWAPLIAAIYGCLYGGQHHKGMTAPGVCGTRIWYDSEVGWAGRDLIVTCASWGRRPLASHSSSCAGDHMIVVCSL